MKTTTSFVLACFISVCLLLNSVNSLYICCCAFDYRFNIPLDVVDECLYQHDYFTDQWTEDYNGYASRTDSCAAGCNCGGFCILVPFGVYDIGHFLNQDDYGIPKFIDDYTPNCGNSLTIVRTWDSGCGFLSQTINIVDTIPPELFVPPDRTQECVSLDGTPGPNFYPGELDNWFGSARATDLCTNPTLTSSVSITSNTDSCNFEMIRTFTANDQCQNTILTQRVSFVDTSPPVIFDYFGSVLSFTCDQTASYDPLLAPPLVTDACSNLNTGTATFVSDVLYQGRCAGDYSIERTWSATDICSNTGYYLQTIIVEDPDPPIVYLNGVPNSGINHYEISFCAVPPPNNYVLVDNCDPSVRGATYLTFEETITGLSEFESHFDVIRTYRATDDCGNYIEWQDVVNVNLGGASVTFTAPQIIGASKGTQIDITYIVVEFSCAETYAVFDIGPAEFVTITIPNCTNGNGGIIYCPINANQYGYIATITLSIFVPLSYAPNNLEVKQSIVSSNPVDHYLYNDSSRTIIEFA